MAGNVAIFLKEKSPDWMMRYLAEKMSLLSGRKTIESGKRKNLLLEIMEGLTIK